LEVSLGLDVICLDGVDPPADEQGQASPKAKGTAPEVRGYKRGLAYFFIKESKADFIEIRVFSVIFFIRAFSCTSCSSFEEF
jgi:hypothetical protein